MAQSQRSDLTFSNEIKSLREDTLIDVKTGLGWRSEEGIDLLIKYQYIQPPAAKLPPEIVCEIMGHALGPDGFKESVKLPPPIRSFK